MGGWIQQKGVGKRCTTGLGWRRGGPHANTCGWNGGECPGEARAKLARPAYLCVDGEVMHLVRV